MVLPATELELFRAAAQAEDLSLTHYVRLSCTAKMAQQMTDRIFESTQDPRANIEEVLDTLQLTPEQIAELKYRTELQAIRAKRVLAVLAQREGKEDGTR